MAEILHTISETTGQQLIRPFSDVQNTPAPAHSTTEHATGVNWTNGKAIYRRTWTGTTPNNTSDNLLFTITGATEIVNRWGRVANSTSRTAEIFGIHSGNNAHGPMFQFYGFELHHYNATGDTRWQNGAYTVTVEYTK